MVRGEDGYDHRVHSFGPLIPALAPMARAWGAPGLAAMGRRALTRDIGSRPGRATPRAGRAVLTLVVLAAVAGCAPLGGATSSGGTAGGARITPRAAGPPPPSATATAMPASTNPSALLAAAVCWYDDASRASACVPPPREALDAIAAKGASGDRRFIAPLIDMRAVDVGWDAEVDTALVALTGQRLDSGAAWYAWLAEHVQPLPAGYQRWKGRLLAISDPTFASILEGPAAEGVRPELVQWAGLRTGELPRLDEPRTATTESHGYLEDGDVVYGLQAGGALAAYPARILAWHSVVQDRVGGVSVLVTYCGPCASASAFSPNVGGRALRFRDAGLWLDGRPLIVDEQTGSLWDAYSGRAVLGALAAAKVELPRLPLVTSRWQEWAADHPSTSVPALETGFVRDYSAASQQKRDASLAVRFPSTSRADDRLPGETRVIGVTVGGEARAYRLDELQARRIVLDTLGGERVLFISQGPNRPVRVYRPGALEVRDIRDDGTILGSDGREGERWWAREQGIVSQIDGRVHEVGAWVESTWRAWSGSHPGSTVWGR
ncbi:MAG: DUF3179 domain-containing (seleno)protein [Dehalococcoidia bacterium]